MKLLVIRHGIAEDKDDAKADGRDDSQRRLTRYGRRRMKRISRALYQLIPDLSLIATSPLVRAVETGDIVAEQYGSEKTVQLPALSPRKATSALLHWLSKQPADSTIALIGHEPQLSLFVSWMMSGLQDSFIDLKKGGACLLNLEKDTRPGHAKLVWLMKPSQLRGLR